MNVIDAEVTEVLSEAKFVNNKEKFGEEHCNWWTVEVKYSDMGGGGKKESFGRRSIMANEQEDNEEATCPECGSEVNPQSGCWFCPVCGWSKCS